jgi:hypothetical protein
LHVLFDVKTGDLARDAEQTTIYQITLTLAILNSIGNVICLIFVCSAIASGAFYLGMVMPATPGD